MQASARDARPVLTAVMALALLAPAAHADNGVRLTINGGGSVYLTGVEVDRARDVALGTPATTRAANGRATVDAEGGTTVATVAALAHVPARFVEAMAIARIGTAGPVFVEGREVRRGFAGDPSGETRYATINTNFGHRVRFFRPLRDEFDINANDSVTTPRDGDLTVDLTTTNTALRDVRATADDTTPKAGAVAAFSGRVRGAPGRVRFTYSWDFGDGTTEVGQTPSHAFAAGHYRVTVTAIGSDGSSGVATPVEIQVDKPRKAAPSKPGPPRPGSGSGAGGPGAGGGARTGGGASDASQSASGPARSAGRSERKRRSERRAAPTATPAPTADAQRRPERPPAPVTTGVPVDGVLLASAGSPAEADQILRSTQTPAGQVRPPVRRGGGDPSAAGWLGGGGLFVFLLAAGALREGGLRWRGLRA